MLLIKVLPRKFRCGVLVGVKKKKSMVRVVFINRKIRRMKKVKRLILFTMILAIGIFFTDLCWAGDIDDLRREMQELRQDYESKINNLQTQLDALSKNQKKKIAEIQEKVDERFLDVEYVGRYEGPFKKGGLLIKNPSGFGNVSVGGYMDLEFENFQNTNSTFDQHRWIINIGAELADRLRFYSEYEIEHGGPNASGGGKAKVEQAWVDYLINDAINLRAGALLVPFGRYNIYHDSDLQDLMDRPLVARDIIPTTWTESGAGFYGEFNPTLGDYEDATLGYEIYMINGLNGGFSDVGLGEAKGSIETDNNNSKAVVGRLLLSPFLGHELGISGYWGRYNGSDDISGVGVDLLSTWGPLELLGEFAYFDVDEPVDSDVANFFKGYYLQANYHFWPEFLNDSFLGRGFEDPTFTLVARQGWAKIDDDGDAVGSGDNEEERFTLGINYRPIESWVFKLEYQWNNTENETLERGDNNGIIVSTAMGF